MEAEESVAENDQSSYFNQLGPCTGKFRGAQMKFIFCSLTQIWSNNRNCKLLTQAE